MDYKILKVRKPEELILEHEKEKNNPMPNYKEYEKGAKNNKVLAVIAGIIAGFINGLFGGGGGMVIVPMLNKFLKLDEKSAHATAILIILPLSLVSALFYLSFGSLELKSAFPITFGVIVGGVIGAFLLKKLSVKKVIGIFYTAMLVSGIKMLFF